MLNVIAQYRMEAINTIISLSSEIPYLSDVKYSLKTTNKAAIGRYMTINLFHVLKKTDGRKYKINNVMPIIPLPIPNG